MRRCRPKFSNSAHLCTPQFVSKLVNVTAYFRHLCIIEKRRPPSAELLDSYGSRYWTAHSHRGASGSPKRRPRDRSIPATLQLLPACSTDSAIFAKFFRTFWSTAPLSGVPDQKFCHQKFCLTMGNMFHTIVRG